MEHNKLFSVSGIFNLHVAANDARDAKYKAQDMTKKLTEDGFDCCIISADESKGDERKFGDKPTFD